MNFNYLTGERGGVVVVIRVLGRHRVVSMRKTHKLPKLRPNIFENIDWDSKPQYK